LRSLGVFPPFFTKALAVLAFGAWLVSSATAEAKAKKDDSGSSKGKGKGKKGKGGKGGSMDDTAGEPDSGLAPGSDDSTARKPDPKAEPPVEAAPVSDPVPDPASDISVEETTPAAPAEPEPASAPSGIKKNWFSLTLQQDALFYTPLSGVCEATDADGDVTPAAPQYSCRDADGLYDGTVYAGAGNEIQSGVGLATTRILVGYDRVFIDRLTIGARIGFAFGGAPTVVGSGTFNPFHGELRSSFFFGDKPFERNGFRPYASLGVGVGEVDGKVSVDFFVDQEGYEDGERGQLDAWRKTGIAFGALGLGVAYPVGPIVPALELRGLMMFGEPAFALAIAGSIAYGI